MRTIKSIIILLYFLFLFACSSKQQIFQDTSTLIVNPEFALLKETYNDRNFRNVKFTNQFDYSGLLVSASSIDSMVKDQNNPNLHLAGLGLGIAYTISSNHTFFNDFLHYGNFLWAPYLSTQKIEYKSFEKELLHHLKKAMNSAGFQNDEFDIKSFWNFGEQRIKIYWNKKIVYNPNNIKKNSIVITEILINKKTCNFNIEESQYKDCLSSIYIYLPTGIEGTRQRYNFDNFIVELSKMPNLYIIFYKENKILINGEYFTYIINNNRSSQ